MPNAKRNLFSTFMMKTIAALWVSLSFSMTCFVNFSDQVSISIWSNLLNSFQFQSKEEAIFSECAVFTYLWYREQFQLSNNVQSQIWLCQLQLHTCNDWQNDSTGTTKTVQSTIPNLVQVFLQNFSLPKSKLNQ